MKKKNTFEMSDYGKRAPFSSFLPGIAGINGTPIWCHYVNRGQAIVSFGVESKDGAIMEFYPAHLAYQNVKTTGFRTFLRIDKEYGEAFANEEKSTCMKIEKNMLHISERNSLPGIDVKVTYFILPGEEIGALARKVTIENKRNHRVPIEILDGCPALIPYGVCQDSMKNMLETAKAWMQVENVKENRPFYRVRASMEDSAKVRAIDGGNFAYAVDENGKSLRAIVDMQAVFSYDLSLQKPVAFKQEGLAGILSKEQNTQNLLPGALFAKADYLESGGKMTLYEIYGQTGNKEKLLQFLEKHDNEFDLYFEEKEDEARGLADDLCTVIETETADEMFDAYCESMYMDNFLRGGVPIRLGHNKIFYVYSRKHGDLERDYNFFCVRPEAYSQGNGNFRDVNQNRRMDTFFHPFVGRENIQTFYGLIQADGYNPLGIEKKTFSIKKEVTEEILREVASEKRKELEETLSHPFTPGELIACLKGAGCENLFGRLCDFSTQEVCGNFGEGYWCDHWTYNLDLVEEYLSLFPDKKQELLLENNYPYFAMQVRVLPRCKRYVKTENGIRQYCFLDAEKKKDREDEKLIRAEGGKGEVVNCTLLEKLVVLCATKYATLDSYGMGIEMEGGKPGWYDALNGLPGLLGSSMAETCELLRLLNFTIQSCKELETDVLLSAEILPFLRNLAIITKEEEASIEKDEEVLAFWNKINDEKEAYRQNVWNGVSGEKKEIQPDELVSILSGFAKTVSIGIRKAFAKGRTTETGQKVFPTYFYYSVEEYEEDEKGIHPLHFKRNGMPLFLEGPVHFLKLVRGAGEKEQVYQAVRESDLFDEKLKMYKVNASLEEAPYELGRCRAFTPGWLENESIFLHMEYKYLLEILKAGLYEQFFEDSKTMLVPFMNSQVYGRSTLENSSFIASSANPNAAIHGKGFVARLSGSTVEFLSMWKRIFFGETPFTFDGTQLHLRFAPAFPARLLPKDSLCVKTTFLGHIPVTYECDTWNDFYPGTYQVSMIELRYGDGKAVTFNASEIAGTFAQDVREGNVKEIRVKLNRNR